MGLVPALAVGMADFRAPTRGTPTLWHGQPAPMHRGPARDRQGQDRRATIWLRLRRTKLPGSAAMCTEGTASRPRTAKGPADIGVQENKVCTRVVTQGPLSGAAAFPALRVLAGPPQDNRCSHRPGAKPASRWKSRKAGVRALRYMFSYDRFANRPHDGLGNWRSRAIISCL
jgi:hypothetical protein